MKIQKVFLEKFGFFNDVIVCSQFDFEVFVKKNFFKGFEYGKQWYFVIIFCKDGGLLVFNKFDCVMMDGFVVMVVLEKCYGKQIIICMWNIVFKIVVKMQIDD